MCQFSSEETCALQEDLTYYVRVDGQKFGLRMIFLRIGYLVEVKNLLLLRKEPASKGSHKKPFYWTVFTGHFRCYIRIDRQNFYCCITDGLKRSLILGRGVNVNVNLVVHCRTQTIYGLHDNRFTFCYLYNLVSRDRFCRKCF